MRQKIELLQFLVHAWNLIDQAFHIGDKVVPIVIDYVYFLTGLFRRGARISLSGFSHGGESVRDYIRLFCWPGTYPSKDGKINIRDVSELPLRTILFTAAKLAGSVTLCLANRSYMQYTLECLEPKVFNWCEVMLSSLKEQLR